MSTTSGTQTAPGGFQVLGGITWTPEGKIPGGQSASTGIAATMAGSELVCVYTGTGGSNTQLYSTFRTAGTGDWNTAKLPFQSAQPAGLATVGATIYCAFQNASSNPQTALYWSASTDPSFPNAQASTIQYSQQGTPGLTQAVSNFGPALVSYNSTLYCVFISPAYNLVLLQYDGEGAWNLVNSTAINENVPSSQPSLAVLGSTLYCVFVGTSGSQAQQMLYTTFSGQSWAAPAAMSSNLSRFGCGLASSNGSLVCAYKGLNDDNVDVTTFSSGGSWSFPPSPVSGQTTDMGPALTGSNPMYLLYEGDGSGGLYWVMGTPSG